MNQRQRALVLRTLQVVGIVALGCWLGGLVIVIALGARNPAVLFLASLGWGFVGLAAIGITFGGWTGVAIAGVILAWFYVRARRVPDAR